MKKNLFAAVSAAFLTLAACNSKEAPTTVTAVGDVAQRIGYFASHGWEAEEISEKDITIPADFPDVYEEYARMQDKQELPLRKYAGRAAKLFVYEIKNYSPDNMKMLAELLVCDDIAVASMVYSEDGGSLRMPVS
ncbi:MAG: DUF4830 domain-containing protein [Ruminococcus sp.]|uniref:DUF4830 domain-containing protein n=1 Tax=Ruminococcus sp. TaxID=41978 RepID=UPI0025F19D44|nr:DUF4830 domain-containing protein [Ruminococcus sp.]MBR5683846.1 DUF4830 domain-containing protein [Ruminococcus sp.]